MFDWVDSAGVEVIHVRRLPSDTMHRDAPAVRIGGDGTAGTESEVFALISDLIPLDGGRLGVVDNRAARVAVFDSLGRWLHDVGGRGSGPGEHTGPAFASLFGDTLFVWDPLQSRVSAYLPGGNFAASASVPRWTSARPFHVTADGYLRDLEWGQLMDPAPAQGAVVRMTRTGRVTDTLAGPYPVPEYGWTIVDPATGRGRMVNPPALEISPPWVAGDTWLLRLDPLAATVEFRSPVTGAVARLLRLPHRATAPTTEEREAFLRGVHEEYGVPVDVIAADTRFAALRPPVAGLLADDRRRVWVAHHEPSAHGRGYVGSDWDVYDLEAGSVMRVQFPRHFRLMALRGRRGYGVSTVDDGVQVVDVFVLDLGS